MPLHSSKNLLKLRDELFWHFCKKKIVDQTRQFCNMSELCLLRLWITNIFPHLVSNPIFFFNSKGTQKLSIGIFRKKNIQSNEHLHPGFEYIPYHQIDINSFTHWFCSKLLKTCRKLPWIYKVSIIEYQKYFYFKVENNIFQVICVLLLYVCLSQGAIASDHL